MEPHDTPQTTDHIGHARRRLAASVRTARGAIHSANAALADLRDGFHPAYDVEISDTSQLGVDLEVFLDTASRCLRAVDALLPTES